jgi:hypothetical protein
MSISSFIIKSKNKIEKLALFVYLGLFKSLLYFLTIITDAS